MTGTGPSLRAIQPFAVTAVAIGCLVGQGGCGGRTRHDGARDNDNGAGAPGSGGSAARGGFADSGGVTPTPGGRPILIATGGFRASAGALPVAGSSAAPAGVSGGATTGGRPIGAAGVGEGGSATGGSRAHAGTSGGHAFTGTAGSAAGWGGAPPGDVGDAPHVIVTPPNCTENGAFPPVYLLPFDAIVGRPPLFDSTPNSTFSVRGPGTPVFAPLDGDALTDVVVDTESALAIYRQYALGAFESFGRIEVGSDDHIEALALSDLNRDGRLDVVLFNRHDDWSGEVELHLQTPEGFDGAPTQRIALARYPDLVGIKIVQLAAQDVNGDARPDLLVLTARWPDPGDMLATTFAVTPLEIFEQQPDGSFAPTVLLAPDEPADSYCERCDYRFAVGDFDDDGDADLAVLRAGHQALYYPTVNLEAEVFVYRQEGGAWSDAAEPVAALDLPPIRLESLDVNGDQRLDLVTVVSGEWEYGTESPPGRTDVLLQTPEGTLAAPVLVPPRGSRSGTLDLVALDGDVELDWVVAHEDGRGGGYLRRQDLLPTTPSADATQLFEAYLQDVEEPVVVEYVPAEGVPTQGTFHSKFTHQWADMNGDGRVDLVGLFVPFLPNHQPDPFTGQYEYEGFQAHTVTDLLVHLQHPPGYELWVEAAEADLSIEDDELTIRARVRNHGISSASGTRVRLLTSPLPPEFTTVVPRDDEEYEDWAQGARRFYERAVERIEGTELTTVPLGRLAPGQAIDFSVQLTFCRADYPPIQALFLVPATDSSEAQLYRSEELAF